MNKLTCVVCLFFVLSVFANNLDTKEWQTLKNSYNIIPTKGKGFPFSVDALEIQWSVTCSLSCNIYLLDEINMNRLDKGQTFNTYYSKIGTTKSISNFRDKPVIVSKVYIYVLNPSNTSTLSANFIQEQLMSDSYAPAGVNWLKQIFGLGGIASSVVALITFCCCCCLVIIGVPLLMFKKNDQDGMKDNLGPTIIVDYGEYNIHGQENYTDGHKSEYENEVIYDENIEKEETSTENIEIQSNEIYY
eukprot:gene9354-1441_t